MTIQQQQAQIITRGRILRSDIYTALKTYNAPTEAVANLTTFLDGCELTQKIKDSVLKDIQSYDYVE